MPEDGIHPDHSRKSEVSNTFLALVRSVFFGFPNLYVVLVTFSVEVFFGLAISRYWIFRCSLRQFLTLYLCV